MKAAFPDASEPDRVDAATRRTQDATDRPPRRSPLQRIVIGSCLVTATLSLGILGVWWRGAQQRARVSNLLQQVNEAAIFAQYRDYHYEPPPMMHGTYDGGEFDLVIRSGQRSHGFGVVDEPPPQLYCFVVLFGERCFTRVTDIDVSDSQNFVDADVHLLLAFPDLRVLDVSGTAITDVGLAQLASLERLVCLDISETSVSPESLRRLSRCKNLRELDMRSTKADEGVAAFLQAALPECWIMTSSNSAAGPVSE